MRAWIVGASPEATPPVADRPVAGDLIIAADGGAERCRRWGWRAAYVIGDLDSLSPAEADRAHADGAVFVTAPVRKDETDMELALQHAVTAGAGEIVIVGAARGGRMDHAVANILLLARADLAVHQVTIIEGRQTLRLIRPGRQVTVCGRPGDIVSLIPVGGDATGVDTAGLEWPLVGESLRFGTARGVSNVLVEPCACVKIDGGLLLLVHIPQDHFQPMEVR